MEVAVRPGSECDIPAIAAIFGHHVATGLASFELQPPSIEEMTRRYANLQYTDFPTWLPSATEVSSATHMPAPIVPAPRIVSATRRSPQTGWRLLQGQRKIPDQGAGQPCAARAAPLISVVVDQQFRGGGQRRSKHASVSTCSV